MSSPGRINRPRSTAAADTSTTHSPATIRRAGAPVGTRTIPSTIGFPTLVLACSAAKGPPARRTERHRQGGPDRAASSARASRARVAHRGAGGNAPSKSPLRSPAAATTSRGHGTHRTRCRRTPPPLKPPEPRSSRRSLGARPRPPPTCVMGNCARVYSVARARAPAHLVQNLHNVASDVEHCSADRMGARRAKGRVSRNRYENRQIRPASLAFAWFWRGFGHEWGEVGA
jgi:hypothetical protein